jgi:hypothetical protein
VQAPAAHRRVNASQSIEAQSVPALHIRPFAHGAQEPPQSTSVSVPFFVPSWQDAATQRWLAPSQVPDTQSESFAQLLVFAHGAHASPPQSTSVSVPSRIPSAHDHTQT